MAETIAQQFTLDVEATVKNLGRVAAATEQLDAVLASTTQAAQGNFAKAAQAAAAFESNLAAAKAEQQAAKAVVAEQVAELRRLTAAERDLNQERKKSTAAAEQARLTSELKKNQTEQKRLKALIDESRVAVEQERIAVEKVREARRGEVQQTRAAAAAARDAAAAAKQQAAATKQTNDAGTGGGLFGGLLGKLGPLAAGLFSVQQIIGRIREGLDNFAEISGVQNTFKALTGSAEAGAKEFAFIKEEANRFGLELAPIARSYASLFAAAKEANLPLSETRNIFQGVSAAAKVFNLTSAETEQALRAVQQMLSKGTVSSQELKLQLGNVLPGAFALAAKAAGLTTKELSKQLELGNIVASDFLPKFAKQLQLTYGSGTADAATSVRSNLGRINTFFQEQSAQLGALFAPLITKLADFVSAGETAAQRAERTAASYFRQADAVRELDKTLPALLSRYNELKDSAGDNTEKQAELRKVIDELAAAVPGAVTAFDKYGKALGINGAAVTAFLANNRKLAGLNQDIALRQGNDNLKKLLEEQRLITARLNSGEEVGGLTRLRGPQKIRVQRATGLEIVERGDLLDQAASDKEITKLISQAADLQAAIQAQRKSLAEIRAGQRQATQASDKDLKDTQGLIEKQQKLIETLRERQKKAANENKGDGTDFLFGKGGLNLQLEAAQKELDRLLGKVEKGRKTADKLGAALRALERERLTLTGLAEKASIRQADDAKERAEQQLAADLRAVELVKQKLIEREKAVRKAGGRGERADSVIDGTQDAQLNLLREAAQQKFAAELFKVEQAKYDQLLSLQADSYDKERELIERRYEKERQAAIGQSQVLQALEAAKQRELLALEFAAGQKRAEQRRAVLTANTEANGVVSGRGTGRSVFEAQQQQRLEQLEIDRQFYQESIDNSVKAEAEKGELIRAEARKQLLLLQKERDEILKASNQFNVYKLVLGDADSPEAREALDAAVGQIATLYSETLAAAQAAADQRIGIANQNISELQTQIAAEIQLNKDGAASNIAGLQEQLEAEKQARRQATIEKRRAAREQVLVDTLMQASNVAVAVSNALASLPIPLNFIAAGLTVAAFIAAKARAFSAASKAPAGFFQGGYTGDGNPREESRAVGPRPYVYHKAEYVIPHEPTAKFRFPLLEPLHKGQYERIDWQAPAMQPLLASMPHLNPKLPGKLQSTMTAVQHLRVSHSLAPMQAQFDAMTEKLSQLERHAARIPAEQIYQDEQGNLVRENVRTGSKTTYVKKK